MNTKTPYQPSVGRLTGLFVIALLAVFASAVKAQTTVVWQDNFESPTVWDNWGVDNGVWDIGAPLTGPATNSAGYRTHEGTNCAATVLAGNYPVSTSSRLIRITPFVVPSASQSPRLEFWHWYAFSGDSYGVVQIKYGTNNWADLSPRYYATGCGVWTRPVVDLKAYAGKAVQIAFRIAADGSVNDGWNVDEVRVIKGDYTVGFTNGLTESFELGLGDWHAETGTWQVGVPTSGPNAAHSGTNCLATVLGANYEDDRSSRFISPSFVVPSADQLPRLRFWEWFSIGGHDYVQVQIKVGTNAWQALGDQITLDSFNRWTRAWHDLTLYAGQTVQVGFYFESHGYRSGSYPYPWVLDPGPGWYVDEVMVETGPLPVVTFPDSFENGWTGWRVDYIGGQVTDFGIWEIGAPTSGPGSAHHGTNCAATVLNGNYPDDRSARLFSAPFVVPSADQLPRLRFWHWYSIAGHDFCEMQIKAGTNSWQPLHRYTSTGSGVWNRQGFDLSPYSGQTVQLGFYSEFHGYQSGSYPYPWVLDPGPGWYVDEVALVTGPLQTLTLNVAEVFEPGWRDWYAEDGTWEIGVPTYGPPTNSLGLRAHSGTNCAGTVLGSNYADDTYGRLVSPPFFVPEVGAHPTLRFWHWFSIAGHDFCEIQIKAAKGDWQPLTRYNPADSGVWTQVPPFDLSPYAGQAVQLGFYFESHGYQSGSYPYPWLLDPGPGWYVDDVTISAVNPPSGIVEFTDARYFINEAEANAVISVARRHGSAGPASVTFWATDGIAVGGDDYDAVVEQIDWADGEEGVKTVSVPIHQDVLVEGNETVSLELIVPGALASSVARESATLVIIDDEVVPPPMVTNIAFLRSLVGTTNWVPTNITSLFTVEGTVTTHTNLSTVAADELFFMQDGTNGIAVLFRGGTNQFMPDAGDRLRVTASLTNINGLLALAPNYANLTNVVWRLSSSNALPTPGMLDFTAGANVPVMEAIEARYLIATNVWVSQSGGASFPTVLTNLLITNQAGLTFNLTIHPKTDIGGKPKPTVPVNIVGVLNQNDTAAPYTTNYALLPTRYADIIGGDPWSVEFVSTSVAALESVPSVTLSVSRTGASSGVVTAGFSIGSGTAAAGTDYVATNGTLTWADGESGVKTFTVELLNDTVEEPDDWFLVNLSSLIVGSNATAVVTIVNDDFVAQPPRQVVFPGASAAMSVTPTASSLGFQWWKDGLVKPNATNATLTLTSVQPADVGDYWAVVTTTAGAVTSTVARVEIAVPVAITSQPQSQTAAEGSQVTLCVGVSGSEPISYQWRRYGSAIADATNSCLVLNNVQTSQSGDYSVVVNNTAGVPATSANATVVVIGGGFVPRGEGMGDYTNLNGCYVAWGSGEDIEGTEDRFFFVNTEWTGDGQILARMEGLVPDNPLSEAGVMVRDGFTGGDRNVFLALNAERRMLFRRRPIANYESLENGCSGTNVTWLRLMRMGDTFVGHCSSNGLNWQLVWWTTVAEMPATLQWGLAVTAHRHTGLATNTFCNVSVSGLTPLPGGMPGGRPWIHLGGEPCAYPPIQQLGGFKMLVCGCAGDQYEVYQSSDLTSWTSAGFMTNSWGVMPFLATGATNAPRLFYRVRLHQAAVPPFALVAPVGFSGGRFGFNVSAAVGETVVVETSSDLRNWTPLVTNTLTTSPLYCSDPDSSSAVRRFYRAVLLQ